MLLATSLTAALTAIAPHLPGMQPHSAPSAPTESDAAENDTREVIATGVGLNEEGARRDMLRAALETAIGMLVDAETQIRNNEVIEEIIVASAGFIESYEELGSKKRDDGLWQVRARVVVRKNLLRKRLVTSKVTSGKVDGASLFARALSRSNNASATARIIAKNLADYPLCAMTVALSESPEVLSNEGEEWLIGLQILFSIDSDSWEKSANALRTALKNIASAVEPVDVEFSRPDRTPSYEKYLKRWSVNMIGRRGKTRRIGLKSSMNHAQDEFVVVLPRSARIGDRCDAFTVPRSLIPEVGRLWGRRIDLFIDFKNAAGETIHTHRTLCPATVGYTLGRWRFLLGPGTFPNRSRVEGWETDALPFNNKKEATKNNKSSFNIFEALISVESKSNSKRTEVAFIPNWMASPLNKEFGEGATAKLAFLLRPSVLEKTTEISLRLESSERPWSLSYSPRVDGIGGNIAVPILPVEGH